MYCRERIGILSEACCVCGLDQGMTAVVKCAGQEKQLWIWMTMGPLESFRKFAKACCDVNSSTTIALVLFFLTQPPFMKAM